MIMNNQNGEDPNLVRDMEGKCRSSKLRLATIG